MNYEELLAARNEGKKHQVMQPIGGFYREQVDGKWRGVIDIRPELNQNIAFTKALRAECEANTKLVSNHQIHLTPVMNVQGDVERLELELGNFYTFEQLLIENPAIVAEKGFIDRTLETLVEVTSYLHQQGIRHICYSPKTVFARKGDNSVMLLSHGSFYQNLSDLEEFYSDDAKYVAPEVMTHGTVDERCDVYGIGKFMMALFDQSDLPLEFRSALKKAVSESPEDRYQTPEDLLKAVRKRRGNIKSVVTLLVACVATLVCLGLYFDMFPESQPVEFVKPVPRQPTDDLLDDGFNPEELGVTSDGDSLIVDEASQRDYQAKAEEIFRKRYEKEADRILSKIYNKEYMNSSEKKFLSESEATIDELMKAQSDMGADAGLAPERSQLIATEIIERITNEKKKQMKNNK